MKWEPEKHLDVCFMKDLRRQNLLKKIKNREKYLWKKMSLYKAIYMYTHTHIA